MGVGVGVGVGVGMDDGACLQFVVPLRSERERERTVT